MTSNSVLLKQVLSVVKFQSKINYFFHLVKYTYNYQMQFRVNGYIQFFKKLTPFSEFLTLKKSATVFPTSEKVFLIPKFLLFSPL